MLCTALSAVRTFYSPLGLRASQSKPGTRLDAVPLVTVLLIAVLFTLLESRFIYAPGLTVSLTGTNNKPKAPLLPHIAQSPGPGAMTQATLVLTAMPEVVLFNKQLFGGTNNLELRNALAQAAVKARETAEAEAKATQSQRRPIVILFIFDSSVKWERIAELSTFASEAGFEEVLLAKE